VSSLKRSIGVKVVEPEVVGEQVRDLAFEGIELRERVFAKAEQDVRAQGRLANRLRKLAGELVVLVIEEVLLELVEDHVHVAANRPGRGLEPFRERSVRLDPGGSVDRFPQAEPRIAGPGGEENDGRVVRPPEGVDDGRAEERGLADPAGAVEDGQAGGEQVGDDNFALPLAPVEEEGVEFGVLEGRKAFEGRRRGLRGHAHALASAGSAAAR